MILGTINNSLNSSFSSLDEIKTENNNDSRQEEKNQDSSGYKVYNINYEYYEDFYNNE